MFMQRSSQLSYSTLTHSTHQHIENFEIHLGEKKQSFGGWDYKGSNCEQFPSV